MHTSSISRSPVHMFSEEELLSALRQRDEHALQYVYQTYWPMVLKLVKVNNGNLADAKDLYQDSMLDLLEKIWNEKFILTCKISTFLYSICHKKWLYRLRGTRQLVDIDEISAMQELPDEPADKEIAAELPSDDQIQMAINRMGEPCRSLLLGFYYEKLSLEQLAARLQYKSAQVVKQQKFRCKERLKHTLLSLT